MPLQGAAWAKPPLAGRGRHERNLLRADWIGWKVAPRSGFRVMWVKTVALFAVAAAVKLTLAGFGDARAAPNGGQVVIPESSVEKPGDVRKRAHTNIEIFVPHPRTVLTPPSPGSPGVGPPANLPSRPQTTGAGGGQGASGVQRP